MATLANEEFWSTDDSELSLDLNVRIEELDLKELRRREGCGWGTSDESEELYQ